MNNSDLPAMPLSNEMSSDLDSAAASPEKYGLPTAMGLTKREAFTMAAITGLCSNPNTNTTGQWQEKLAKDAAVVAETALRELEK